MAGVLIFKHISFQLMSGKGCQKINIVTYLHTLFTAILCSFLETYFYRPQTKLREGNVFTSICDSVHGGCTPSGQTPPRQTYTPRQTPPRQTPPKETSQADTPPQADTSPPKTGTEAGSSHPTGMHSCSPCMCR